MSEEESNQPDPMREAFKFAAECLESDWDEDEPTLEAGEWNPPELGKLDELLTGYEVKGLLGRGGMGAVYEAIQTSLDRKVAIKIMSPELAKIDASFVTRFQREAKAMARLDHPNIVTVYDFGKTEEGHCYFVMEYVDGADFHQLIRSGGLNTKSALEAVGQICDALEYAHDKGFVHRDIKPANIFINQEHRIKVGDFGLAKIVKSEKERVEDSSLLTQPGAVMGTPWYSAPEQLSGGEVDQRADIYSLGVMFYEMLTGEVPRGAVSPPSRRVQLDIRLDEVVLRAMADQPEARYQTVAEVRTDVDKIRTTTPPVAPRKEEKPSRSPFAIIAVLVAIALAGAGWYYWKTSPHHALKADLEEKFPVTSDSGEKEPGEKLIFESIAGGKGRPVLVDLIPGNDVEFIELPPELDGVISASMLPATPKNIFFVRKDGQLWFRKESNEQWFREASSVRKVLCSYHPYAITEAGDLIRPTYTKRRDWKVHAAGPWVDVEPGIRMLVGINHERKLVPIPDFESADNNDPEKSPGLFQLPEFEDAKQVSLGTGTGMVMDQEGNWREWGWGNVEGLSHPDYLVKMRSVGAAGATVIGITQNGRVVIHRNQKSDDVRRQLESIRDAEAVFTGAGAQTAFAIRLQGNRWRLLIREEAGNSLKLVDPAITDALTGCREVALTTEVAIGLRDLPEETPYDFKITVPGIQGGLQGWSVDPNRPVDLSKAEGIDDFVQVITVQQPWDDNQPGFGWAALRANGQVVTSSSVGEELRGVTRLIEGMHSFGALLKDGSLVCYDNYGILQTVLERGTHPVKVAITASSGLGIKEDGSLLFWGHDYRSGKLSATPERVLKARIRGVVAVPEFHCVLTESGCIIAWGEKGEFELPSELQREVEEIVAVDNFRIAYRKGNEVKLYSLKTGETWLLSGASEPVRRLKLAHEAIVIEGEAGERHVLGRGIRLGRPTTTEEEISRRISDLPDEPSYAVRLNAMVSQLYYIGPKVVPEIQGRLHAWITTGEVPIDLSKAQGIEDFEQVISVRHTWDKPSTFGWAALRSNGRVVSSSGVGEELQNVDRLIESPGGFGAIFDDGSVLAYGNQQEIHRWTGAPGEKAVDAAAAPTHGLCILENGHLRHWGLRYDSGPLDKRWPEPPVEVSNVPIRDIGVRATYAFALTEQGGLFAWGQDGAIERPDEILEGVEHAAPVGNQTIAFYRDGTVYYWNVERGEVIPFSESLPDVKRFKVLAEGVVLEGKEGRRLFLDSDYPAGRPKIPELAISDRISNLSEGAAYAVQYRENHPPVRQVYAIEEGRLRGWDNHPEWKIDMSRAEGINDFVDVVFIKGDIHQIEDAPFAWAALRANGEVLISDGCEETLGDVTRLIPGFFNFSVIRKDGSLHCYDPNSQTFLPTPLDGSEQIRDAWVYLERSGLALLESGELRDWGKRVQPPAEVLQSRIVDAAANIHFALAVSDEGRLFGWDTKGELDVPGDLQQGVGEVVCANGGFYVRKGQDVYFYRCEQGDYQLLETLKEPARSMLNGGQTVVVTKQNGHHSLLKSPFDELLNRLGNLDPNFPFSAQAHGAGGIQILMHIEPATNESE